MRPGWRSTGFRRSGISSITRRRRRAGSRSRCSGAPRTSRPNWPNIFRQLNVGVDEIIPHFQQFSERIHAHGAALMCQITHLGRRGEPYASNWLPTIGPSPIRETLHRSFPKEMDEHDIVRVVKAYGAAARRCREGALDGIEVLGGGHLLGQFLSPKTNRRTDTFGGSLECSVESGSSLSARRAISNSRVVTRKSRMISPSTSFPQ